VELMFFICTDADEGPNTVIYQTLNIAPAGPPEASDT
jgi:hypothetical protein